MRDDPCKQCGGLPEHVMKYDAFGCRECLVWTEELHTPENCPTHEEDFEYAPERPTRDMFKKRMSGKTLADARRKVAENEKNLSDHHSLIFEVLEHRGEKS